MIKSWWLLGKGKRKQETPPPVALPDVWVTETHTYNTAEERIEVRWRLNCYPAQTDVLLVAIYHSSTANGASENWTWQMPAGETHVEGLYLYPKANITSVTDLVYGIVAGAGYVVPNTATRPKEKLINIAATLPAAPVTPAAPTNGVVDDSANTLTFTLVPGFTTAQHEESLDKGVTWVTCDNNVVAVGNVNKAVGDVRVRVKALNGNPAGNQLFNATAFTLLVQNGSNLPANYDNPGTSTYSAPLIITAGGTYTGNWESIDETIPAVAVRTEQAVVIINSNTKANGYGIQAQVDNTNITILNCRHKGGALSNRRRTFVVAERVKNLRVEHCTIEGSGGFYVAGRYRGNGTENETIKIRYNYALNIDGRTLTGDTFCQFFQSNTLRTDTVYRTDNAGLADEIKYYQGIPHMEIAFNKVINQPGLSHVEDNINIYNSRGHTASPINIHNNYINGAYYWVWQREDYTGSGMICDSPGTNRGACSAYVNFHRNIVILSNAAPFGIAGGNNVKITECVGVGKGVINSEDATRLGATGAGTELRGYPSTLYVDDNRYKQNSTYDNVISDYTDGVVGQHSISIGYWRNDFSRPTKEWPNAAWVTILRLNILPDPITRAVEDHYTSVWNDRVTSAQLTIGAFAKTAV